MRSSSIRRWGRSRGHKVDATPLIIALPTGCAGASDEIRVPSDWALKPSVVSAGGKFRLLFVTSTLATGIN